MTQLYKGSCHCGAIRFCFEADRITDPLKQTLEAFELQGDDWRSLGKWREDDEVAVPPFEAVRLTLSALWSS